MFAGPNGSGKSTLKAILPEALLGIYLNPDEIENSIRQCGHLDLSSYEIQTSADEVLHSSRIRHS
jgi:predicted ABC-type ATPase